jgi:hypothetical protein
MMASVLNSIMLQALYYGVVVTLTIVLLGVFQRGFFATYWKVRTSFGKYIMIKVRSPLRDYFMKGWVEDGFVQYEIKHGFMDKSTVRIKIEPDSNPFYKCMSVIWVDVDDDRHAICKCDYSVVSGHDPVKIDNIIKRALMRPSVNGGMEKIMLFLMVICVIGILVGAYFGYVGMAKISALNEALPSMLKNIAGKVVGGGSV